MTPVIPSTTSAVILLVGGGDGDRGGTLPSKVGTGLVGLDGMKASA